MNRHQRRFGKTPKPTPSDGKIRVKEDRRSRNEPALEEVFCQKTQVKPKATANRCCNVSPDQREFGQYTEVDWDQYQQILEDQYGFSPPVPDKSTQLNELRRMLCGDVHKVENSSQYAPACFIETSDGAQWQNIDNIDDIDRLILQGKDKETITNQTLSKTIHISEVPRVKIIAEKFTRHKQNNLELRRLDEKVVCVEYDIFNNTEFPVQVMRAFFAIRPVYDGEGTGKTITELPTTIKNKFKIAFEDLQKLSEKEVEIIDGKIAENRPYLDDLRKILRRKHIVSKKDKNTIDLQTLYEMATMEYLNYERDNSNMLSKEEMKEVKDLILKKCKSSAHGISRRVFKNVSETEHSKETDIGAISQSIVAELLKDDSKLVFNKR